MFKTLTLALTLTLTAVGPCLAQTDPLAKCLADSTTGRERKDLARWMFLSLSSHPELRQLSAADANVVDLSDRAMGALVTRLLTDACASEVQAAARSGDATEPMKRAFESLGQLAVMELMVNKDVSAAVSRFGRYADQKKIESLMRAK